MISFRSVKLTTIRRSTGEVLFEEEESSLASPDDSFGLRPYRPLGPRSVYNKKRRSSDEPWWAVIGGAAITLALGWFIFIPLGAWARDVMRYLLGVQ